MTHLNDTVPVETIGFFARAKNTICEIVDLFSVQWRIQPLLPKNVVAMQFFARISEIGRKVRVAHNPSHALEFIYDMLTVSQSTNMQGCFVEAGCFKGGSTAKFSVLAKMLGRELVVFDSFEGMPENNEQHVASLKGHSIEGWFDAGKFAGSIDEVKANLQTYGEPDACRLMKGWFNDTMPSFTEPVLAAYLDVDLAESTRTCLKHLYPLLVPGGVICSQDGDFPLVVDVFRDQNFWRNEVGVEPPPIEGLGNKITRIRKPLS